MPSFDKRTRQIRGLWAGLGRLVESYWADERGSTAIEYALIAMMTGIIAITALTAMSDEVVGIFENVILALFPKI